MKKKLRPAVSLAAVTAMMAVLAVSGLAIGQSSEPEKTVMGWGSNEAKQLGPDDSNDPMKGTLNPVKIPDLAGVKQVAAGFRHSLALMIDPDGPDGSAATVVRAWGYAASGTLGPGNTTDSATPLTVSGLTDVIQVSAGNQFSIALKDGGTVWAWGDNSCSQLGNPVEGGGSSAKPVQVMGLPEIVKISAGKGHSLALDKDGKLWAWGSNASGQLGNGTVVAPAVLVDPCRLAPPYPSPGQAPLVPVQIPQDAGAVIAFAAGDAHSLAVTEDGRVWGWGFNCDGQVRQVGPDDLPFEPNVPLPTHISMPQEEQVRELAAGRSHSLALTSDGDVYAWGRAELTGKGSDTGRHNSRCPLSPFNIQPEPVKVDFPHTAGPIVSTTAGQEFSAAIDDAGSVFTWGRNYEGQLGWEDPEGGVRAHYNSPGVALSPRKAPLTIAAHEISARYRHALVIGQLEMRRPSPSPSPSAPPTGSDPSSPGEPIGNAVTKALRDVSGRLPASPYIPAPEPPILGSGGRVLVTGWEPDRAAGECAAPRCPGQSPGARRALRRMVGYVTPGNAAPRLLYAGARNDAPESPSDEAGMQAAGFSHCLPGMAPSAPGCYETAHNPACESVNSPNGSCSNQEDCVPQTAPGGFRDCRDSDHDLRTVRFEQFDAVVVMSQNHPAQSFITLQRRRAEFPDYVNSGHGLLIFHQAFVYDNTNGFAPPDDPCKFERDDPQRSSTCYTGTWRLLPWLDDRWYGDADEQLNRLLPDRFRSTEKGHSFGFRDEDVQNQYAEKWFSESCNFDVLEVDSQDRILTMGTDRRIPDETPCSGLSVPPASVVEGNEGTRPLSFEVKLNNTRAEQQSVHYRTADGSASSGENDYLPAEGTIVFGPHDPGPKKVTVDVVGDVKPEKDETVLLHLEFVQGSATWKATAQGTIVDDDSPPAAEEPPAGSLGLPAEAARESTSSFTDLPAAQAPGAAAGSAPGPASSSTQAVIQLQAPAAQAQTQAHAQTQVQAQAVSQGQAHAPQVGLMEEKQKQGEIQRAYLDNELIPAELLASARRPSPALPLAVMVFSAISAVGLGLIRRKLATAPAEEEVPPEAEEDDSSLAVWLRRRRHQR